MTAEGRTASFDEVAHEVSGPLLRYLGRQVGDPALAEDLLQETLLRIARGLPGFEGRAQVKTWAYAIATRVVADHFREPARRIRIVEVAEADDLPAAAASVDDSGVAVEMNACVRRVIDSLPEDYRAALVLHDLEGLTAAQTAEVCACSVPTAKIRIFRARLRLKEALGRECTFYRDSENVLRCDRKGRDTGG